MGSEGGKMKLIYYPGCTLKNSARNFDVSTVSSMAELDVEVEELDRWNCCGTVHALGAENVMNRVAPVTNLIRVGPSWEANPTQKLTLSAAYYGLFANDRNNNNGFLGNGYFRGQLITAVAKYKFNRYVSGHLWAEYLIPGDYYNEDNRDNAVFLRAELNLTF